MLATPHMCFRIVARGAHMAVVVDSFPFCGPRMLCQPFSPESNMRDPTPNSNRNVTVLLQPELHRIFSPFVAE